MKKRIQVTFGSVVKQKRQELGISQEELANRAELHRTYVADIERGARNPSLLSIVRICQGLGLPLGSVFQTMDLTLGRKDGRSGQDEHPPA